MLVYKKRDFDLTGYLIIVEHDYKIIRHSVGTQVVSSTYEKIIRVGLSYTSGICYLLRVDDIEGYLYEEYSYN